MTAPINYQTILIINSLILLLSLDSRFLFPKKITIVLSFHLLAILFLSFFFSYNLNHILLLSFLVTRFYFLLNRYQNWSIPVISFLWRCTLNSFIWLFTFFLPGFLFGFKFGNSLKEITTLFVVQLILLLSFSLLTNHVINKFDIITRLSNNKKTYKKEGIVIIVLYSLVFFTHLLIFSALSFGFFIFSFLTLTISAFLFVIFFYTVTLSYQKVDEYQALATTLLKITDKHEQLNDFRHDYNGLLLSINGYLQAGDIDGAKKYINSLVDYSATVLVPDYYTQLDKIPIPPVQSVLASFGEKALERKIHFHLTIQETVTHLGIDIIDFVRCLSILLSNAFEAVSSHEKPIVHVKIEKTDHFLLLEIKNPDSSTIPLNNMLVKGFSSKKNNAGRGLHIVSKLCENYTGANFYIERVNGIFIASFYSELPLNHLN